MKFLKFTSALLAALLFLSSCSQSIQDDNTDITGSTADNTGSADEEQTASVTDDNKPGTDDNTDNKKGLIKTVQTDGAGSIFFLENGNILLLRQPTSSDPVLNSILGEPPYKEGRIIIYDSDIKEKTAEIPIEPFHEDYGNVSVLVQIVEDGFAVINMNEKYIKLYDNDGKETKTINPPYYENAEYVVSYDKTRIAYYYRNSETGEGHLVTDSVDLNDKKEIMTFGLNEDKIGTLVAIERLFSYKNGTIAFSGYLDEITSQGKAVMVYGRCNYDGGDVAFNRLEELETLNTNATPQENYFVVIEDSNPNPDIPSSGIVKYQKYEEDKIGELTCEEVEENHFAVISDNGKYIATLINVVGDPLSKIIKIYDTSDGKLLYTHSINLEKHMDICSINIKEQEREVYIFWFESIDVIGF